MYVCPYCKALNRPKTYECDCIGGIKFCRCKYCRRRFLPPESLAGNWGEPLPTWVQITPTCVHATGDKIKQNVLIPGIDNIPLQVKIKSNLDHFDYQEYIHNKYKEEPMNRREFHANPGSINL